MTCKKCNGAMEDGEAIVAVWSGNGERGQCIRPVGGKLQPVMKCTDCGHSVSFQPRAFEKED